MFKINSEFELLQLLKVVSEEAVKKSKKTLNESVDSAQERYMSTLRKSEQSYNVSLTEQEEAESEPENKEPAEEPEDETVDPETLGVSFDSVVKDINTLRSGRSTKDKEIKDELLGYYDRLDEDERKILHLFLGEISKILQGAIEASEAQDPSDPPFNAEVTFGKEDEPSADQPAKQKVNTPAPDTSNPDEDTSPPIRVNEMQDLREIKKRVRRLMKRI